MPLPIPHDGSDTLFREAGTDTLFGRGGTSIEGNLIDELTGRPEADCFDCHSGDSGDSGEFQDRGAEDTARAFTSDQSWTDLT